MAGNVRSWAGLASGRIPVYFLTAAAKALHQSLGRTIRLVSTNEYSKNSAEEQEEGEM